MTSPNSNKLMFYLTSYLLKSVDRIQKLIMPTYLFLLSISYFFYMISMLVYFSTQRVLPNYSNEELPGKPENEDESGPRRKSSTRKSHEVSQSRYLVHTIQQNLLMNQQFQDLLKEAWNTVIPDGYHRKEDLREILAKLGNHQKYVNSLSLDEQRFLKKVHELVLLEDACKTFQNDFLLLFTNCQIEGNSTNFTQMLTNQLESIVVKLNSKAPDCH
ncbi:hypothetical protein K493DRAFT_295293 [Basidiobolus meristosporus CBS 931.73]|uniref:Uncharacterized protein n=1 Tax=Basidiobolus meristosporus CBS 931.73 TaxID=1314790 RepID=A0A1Y1ZD04_9FUNG|nr:hypothetical protein K493DRAFT_295293 [Basidiobolus meristosporus CBS 931.73]|eukprot:ORY07847.1 hypothetical protein K493DRAFT_295293 [Basidiobolus meristosporus CBS 931.73]